MLNDEEKFYAKEGLEVPKIPYLDNSLILGENLFFMIVQCSFF